MNKRFFLGAYWGARKESVEQCASRLDQFLKGLKQIDPTLAQWYERGRSRKDAMERQVSLLPPPELQALLLKGRNRYDEGGGVIEELGFSLGMWNGATSDDNECSLRVGCGSSESTGNSVVLDLPMQCDFLSSEANATSLLALAAKSWKPDWAGIISKSAILERGFKGAQPFVDWMVYVPRMINAAPSFATVMPLEGLGSIVIVQPEPPQGDDPEELRRIGQVEAAISA